MSANEIKMPAIGKQAVAGKLAARRKDDDEKR
jgi:hypothetical protein